MYSFKNRVAGNERGFSLLELVISMTVTLVVLGIVTTLIAQTFRVKSRENRRMDALADAQRGLNTMSREIGNSGFKMLTNGIVTQDSGDTSVRVLANLDRYTGSGDLDVTDAGEDIKYFYDTTSKAVIRYDPHEASAMQKTVLADRVDALRIFFYNQKVDYTTGDCTTPLTVTTSGVTKLTGTNISGAKYVVIALCVNLPAEGVPSAPGYQPATQTLLVSDVTLRNANLIEY